LLPPVGSGGKPTPNLLERDVVLVRNPSGHQSQLALDGIEASVELLQPKTEPPRQVRRSTLPERQELNFQKGRFRQKVR